MLSLAQCPHGNYANDWNQGIGSGHSGSHAAGRFSAIARDSLLFGPEGSSVGLLLR